MFNNKVFIMRVSVVFNHNLVRRFTGVFALSSMIVLSASAILGENAKVLIKQLPMHAEQRYHHPDMSPDGNKVAYSVDGAGFNVSTIWVRDLQDNSTKQLTFSDTTMSIGDVLIEWSPDGQHLAFVSDRGGENNLYLISANGGEFQKLTTKPIKNERSVWNCRFSWSPDGKYIVYSDTEGAYERIYTMQISDGTTEQITDDNVRAHSPDWSPDGSSLVYVGTNSAGASGLWIYQLITGETRRIGNNLRGDYPIWSPDGEWIVFQRGGSRGFRSYIVSALDDTMDAIKVGPIGDYASWGPTWDVDGKQLLYHAGEVVDAPLVIYNINDDEDRQLINNFNPLGVHWATWSNDSQYLTTIQIIESEASREDTLLTVIDTNTGKTRQLLQPLWVDDWAKRQAPAWNSENKNICYVTKINDMSQLITLDIETDSFQVLTESPLRKIECAWSKDGELLAYVAGNEGEEDIWIYDLIAEEELQITFSGGRKSQVIFSPDNMHLTFTGSILGKPFDIFAVPVDGGEIVNISVKGNWNFLPQWIDGNNIIFSTWPPSSSIDFLSIEGKKIKTLYNALTGGVVMPFLNPVSNVLYYMEEWSPGGLKKVELSTGEVSSVIDSSVFRPLFSPDATKVAYIRKENEPLVTIWSEDISEIIRPKTLP